MILNSAGERALARNRAEVRLHLCSTSSRAAEHGIKTTEEVYSAPGTINTNSVNRVCG
jgi:hypothetical protein